jgi:CheY-like chemotaxis protein
MATRIILFHDVAEFRCAAVSALQSAGFSVVAFSDSFAAWEAISLNMDFRVMITRVSGPPGSPPGLALARKARATLPGIKVIFTSTPENAHFADELADVLLDPISTGQIIRAVRSALGEV